MNSFISAIRLPVTLCLLAACSLSYAISPDDLADLRKRDPSTKERPDSAAFQVAKRMGSSADIEALREIVNLGDPVLLNVYANRFGFRGELPEEVEPIIVELLHDNTRNRSALRLIGVWNGGCHRTYGSRQLFDALRSALLDQNNAVLSKYVMPHIVCTSRTDVDVSLAETLTLVKPQNQHPIIGYLAKRRSLEALPLLENALNSIPTEKDSYFHSEIDRALLAIDTPEAMAAIYRRIEWLAAHPHAPGVELEATTIARQFSYLQPPATPVSYTAMRPLLTAFPDSQSTSYMIKLAINLRDPAAVRDLLPLLDGPHGNLAVTAILELGGPDDWSEADATIARLADDHEWNTSKRRGLRARLTRAATEPEKVLAERGEMRRAKVFRESRAQLARQQTEINNLRGNNHSRYAMEMESHLQRAGKLIEANTGLPEANGYRQKITQAYQNLAAYVRFTLGDPNRALTLYQRAIELTGKLRPPGNVGILEHIGIADTLRFDLENTQRALAVYQQLLKRLSSAPRSTNNINAYSERVIEEWLRAEVDFLALGKRYAGTPDRYAIAGMSIVMNYGADGFNREDLSFAAMADVLRQRAPGDDEKRDFAKQMEALTPSQARIPGAFGFLPLLGSPDRIAEFMRRNDPAGFLTASAFAVWRTLEQEPMVSERQESPGMDMFSWNAADRALMEAAEIEVLGRRIVVNTAADPDLATPESTWNSFVEALRFTDWDAAWKCTTPGIRNKFEPHFRKMTPQQLKEMADSSSEIQRISEFGEFVETVVTRANGRAGTVTFVRQGKEWRITEM